MTSFTIGRRRARPSRRPPCGPVFGVDRGRRRPVTPLGEQADRSLSVRSHARRRRSSPIRPMSPHMRHTGCRPRSPPSRRRSPGCRPVSSRRRCSIWAAVPAPPPGRRPTRSGSLETITVLDQAQAGARVGAPRLPSVRPPRFCVRAGVGAVAPGRSGAGRPTWSPSRTSWASFPITSRRPRSTTAAAASTGARGSGRARHAGRISADPRRPDRR